MRYIIIFLTLVSTFPSFAQNCESCNASLRQDIYTQSNDAYIAMSYMLNITEREYEDLKKEFEHTGKVPIPWLGGIIDGTFNYNDFKNKVREFLLNLQSDTKIVTSNNYNDVITNPIAYTAWSKCMETCNQGNGIFIWKIEDGENYGVYKLRYSPAPQESDSIFCTIDIKTEDSTITQKVVLFKNGSYAGTFPRKFKGNRSTTLVTVNAAQKPNGGNSYGNAIKSVYIIPKEKEELKVLSLNYSYVVTVSKEEVGVKIPNCEIIREHVEPRGSVRGFARTTGRSSEELLQARLDAYNKSQKNVSMNAYVNNDDCSKRETGMSCDGKWFGRFAILEIRPSEGYRFNNEFGYNNLQFEGPMAAWNWGQRCPQNDKILLNKPDIKQFKVWLHKEVTAFLKATSYKDVVMNESTFPFLNEYGLISFDIPTERLIRYSIDIRLSDGRFININPTNAREKAVLKVYGNKTRFTLKGITN